MAAAAAGWRNLEVVVHKENVAGWLLGVPEESCLTWQGFAFSFLIDPTAFSTFLGPTQLTAFFSLVEQLKKAYNLLLVSGGKRKYL